MPALEDESKVEASKRVVNRLERFAWSRKMTEWDNYKNLDVQHV